VAIKVLRSSHLGDLDRELFLKEAAILRSCRQARPAEAAGAAAAAD